MALAKERIVIDAAQDFVEITEFYGLRNGAGKWKVQGMMEVEIELPDGRCIRGKGPFSMINCYQVGRRPWGTAPTERKESTA